MDLREQSPESPLFERAFWAWYLPSIGGPDPVLSQRSKDRWSQRMRGEHCQPGEVRCLRLLLPKVASAQFQVGVGLNSWSHYLSLGSRGIGCWDEIRWCPHVLRSDELYALADAIEERKESCMALLLLSPFVATLDKAELPLRRERVASAFIELGFAPRDFTDRAIPLCSESDYRWAYDAARGVVVEGEYLGYTQRVCDEGAPGRPERIRRGLGAAEPARFPWAEMRALRAGLGLADRPEGVVDHVHRADEPAEPQVMPEPPKTHPLLRARVRHAKFGGGVVESVDTQLGAERASVRFDNGDTKLLITRVLTVERDSDEL